MSAKIVAITLAIFFVAVCRASSQETFDDAASNSLMCSKNCTDKYTTEGLIDECQRGCRFHVIEEFFISSDLNATQMNLACYGSCVEAYSENSSRTDACKDGCDIQQKIVMEKKADEEPSIHLLSPLMQVHAIYSSVVGAVHIIRSSLITYFIRDDNKIIAVESEPEIVLGIDTEAAADGENPLVQAQDSRQLTVNEENDEPSVVKCVSQQIGVPPYILVASVVALVVFSLYVIIALCSTNNTSKAKAFSNGKNIDIDPMPLPVKLVRPEDLTRLSLTEEEDLQAPPLPTKVKLPDTMI
ncbi:transmembrane protein 59-like [Macrobrachium nipponense]|uniref:transmembrane protein 59-like n=1 Tax=Macrobrachium nipponense TaxID=159736 RepID=UPI0030C8C65F